MFTPHVSVVQHYHKKTLAADPLVCAFGLFAVVPFLSMALATADVNSYLCWFLILVGEVRLSLKLFRSHCYFHELASGSVQIFLCLNWAPVAALVLYVVEPQQRAMANSFQTLISHLLGDAFSPFLIGYVRSVVLALFPGLIMVYLRSPM